MGSEAAPAGMSEASFILVSRSGAARLFARRVRPGIGTCGGGRPDPRTAAAALPGGQTAGRGNY